MAAKVNSATGTALAAAAEDCQRHPELLTDTTSNQAITYGSWELNADEYHSRSTTETLQKAGTTIKIPSGVPTDTISKHANTYGSRERDADEHRSQSTTENLQKPGTTIKFSIEILRVVITDTISKQAIICGSRELNADEYCSQSTYLAEDKEAGTTIKILCSKPASRVVSNQSPQITSEDMTPSKVRRIQIAAAYLAHIFGMLGCKIRIQGVSCANTDKILRVDTDVLTLGIVLATNGNVRTVKILLIQGANERSLDYGGLDHERQRRTTGQHPAARGHWQPHRHQRAQPQPTVGSADMDSTGGARPDLDTTTTGLLHHRQMNKAGVFE